MIESLLKRWLESWHGSGEAHQGQYFRCHGCLRIVTWTAIRQGGCTCKVSNKLSPAALTVRDKIRLLVAPWSVVR